MCRYKTKNHRPTKKSKRWSVRLNAPKPEPTKRPKTLRYNKEALDEAVEQCRLGMTRKQAEKVYNVPAATITDRLHSAHSKPRGRPTILSPDVDSLSCCCAKLSILGRRARSFTCNINRARISRRTTWFTIPNFK